MANSLRTPAPELHESSEAAFEAAVRQSLRHAVRHIERPGRADAGGDIVIDVKGRRLVVQIKAMANGEPGRLTRAAAAWRKELRGQAGASGEVVAVVVADQLAEAAKDVLRKNGIGWLDRRGHLHIEAEGLYVNDTGLTPLPRERANAERPPIRGRAAMTAALLLLENPDDPPGVRAMAAAGQLAPSSVSEALRELRQHRLVRADGRPFAPDLFWALAEAWAPEPVGLARRPQPTERRLDLALDDLSGAGWAVTGSLAAVTWGAPLALIADHPPDFYAPSHADVRAARRELGDAGSDTRRATVAAAPVPVVTAARLAPSRPLRGLKGWPVVHPVVAALDIAQDRARGPELLDDWAPPPPFRRVW